MKVVDKRIVFPVASLCLAFGVATSVAQTYKPKHINRALELLADGQPIYYTGSHSGTNGTFEQGVKDAQTYADYISYDMEHAPFDVKGLSEYMKGLVKGGPTKSGHRTPTVSPPAVTISGIRCTRGNTIVNGPGQKAFANFSATAGQSTTHRLAISALATCTMSGLCAGRPLIS